MGDILNDSDAITEVNECFEAQLGILISRRHQAVEQVFQDLCMPPQECIDRSQIKVDLEKIACAPIFHVMIHHDFESARIILSPISEDASLL